jgi:hypothetical protein
MHNPQHVCSSSSIGSRPSWQACNQAYASAMVTLIPSMLIAACMRTCLPFAAKRPISVLWGFARISTICWELQRTVSPLHAYHLSLLLSKPAQGATMITSQWMPVCERLRLPFAVEHNKHATTRDSITRV